MVTNRSFTRLLTFSKHNSDRWLIEPHSGPILITTKIYAFDHSVRTAYLDSERGFFNFSSLCLQVDQQTHLPIDCRILPTPLTKGWEVITSLPHKAVSAKGFGLYRSTQLRYTD
jgi:predicted metalloprotease with PDZ domain